MEQGRMLRKGFNKLYSSTLVKVFSLTTISTLVKMITGFITMKVVAVIVGPLGIALLGQLQNFTAILMTVATGGISNGVIRFTSEYKNEPSRLSSLLSAALRITLFVSLACSVVLILFSGSFSRLILFDDSYSYVFILFGCTLLFFTLNNLLISILNGFQEYRRFVYASIGASIIGLVFTVLLIWMYKLEGALVSAVTYQSVVLFCTVFVVWRSPWFHKANFRGGIKKDVLRKYLSYSLMTLTSAATVPVAQLLIRGRVVNNLSVDHAGWWEGINRLSGMYLLVVTSALTVYYLPRLAELSDKAAIKREIRQALNIIMPVLAAAFLVIYFCRVFLVRLLFSQEFLPMEILFSFQLIGDFFKIASWLFAFIMIAKSLTFLYISTEVIFTAILVLSSLWLIQRSGIVGATQGYMITYMLYFFTMFIWSRRYLKS